MNLIKHRWGMSAGAVKNFRQLPDYHEESLIIPENESQSWARRLRRDEGVAPTMVITTFTEPVEKIRKRCLPDLRMSDVN
jgi:hypothetical protein